MKQMVYKIYIFLTHITTKNNEIIQTNIIKTKKSIFFTIAYILYA